MKLRLYSNNVCRASLVAQLEEARVLLDGVLDAGDEPKARDVAEQIDWSAIREFLAKP